MVLVNLIPTVRAPHGRRRRDLAGSTLGRLTAIAAAPNDGARTRWLCRCACDAASYLVVDTTKLTLGHTRSCGCITAERLRAVGQASALDLVGQTFGRLTVVQRVDRDGPSRFVCRCSCWASGRIVEVDGSHLVRSRGGIRSCGCLRRGADHPRLSDRRAVTLREQYRQHVSKSGARGHLSFEQWQAIVLQPCHYCGGRDRRSNPNGIRHGRSEDCIDMVGVDRVDSALGYVVDNCLPCCKHCNVAKRDRSYGDFIAWVHRAHAHLAARS